METMTQSSINRGGEVVLFKDPDGAVRLDVRLERETVWLSLDQMVKLFRRDKSVISRHLRNVFSTRELDRKSVVAKNATTAADGKTYQVDYFNLDAILSVGYRVNSKRGTQFRIWATRTLKDHLLRGYTLNEKRLRERGLGKIEQAVGLLARTLTQHALVTDEGRAVLEVVQQYTRAWKLLLEYDEGRLAEMPARPVKPAAGLSLEDARKVIARLRDSLAGRGEATDLFGAERSDQLSRHLKERLLPLGHNVSTVSEEGLLGKVDVEVGAAAKGEDRMSSPSISTLQTFASFLPDRIRASSYSGRAAWGLWRSTNSC